jgi:CHAD domain-containing protein
MLAPADLGWDLALYARAWLGERAKVALEVAEEVAREPRRGAVHDVRVACRRLREAIAFFRDVPELPPLRDVDRAARGMARVVRRLREMDVAAKRLAELEWGPPSASASEVASLVVKLAAELGRARTELASDKRTRMEKRARQLRDAIRSAMPRQLVHATNHGRDASQEQAFQAFVEARVAARRAEVERLFASARSNRSAIALARATDELHAVRVAVKHWRYASEIARPAIPRVLYRPMAAELRRLQDLGGASQDFADLVRVVEEQLSHASKGRNELALRKAVRAAGERAALAFAEALIATFPSARPKSATRAGRAALG